jgi:hypothetical protein
MRKFIMITAIVLASASAQAADRSLTLAGSDASPAPAADTAKTAEAPKLAETPPATEAPKYVERPAAVETRPAPPAVAQPVAAPPIAEPAKPVAQKTASAPKVEKPRRRRYWTEARIIHELHRHGIYW